MSFLLKINQFLYIGFKLLCNFALNMTRHASHQNCAPGRVLEFYTLAVKGGAI